MARRALASIGIIALIFGLAGCYQEVPADELPAYTLVQHSRDAFAAREFGYLDSSGEIIELECPPVGLFERRHCESADGVVHMEYSVRRSQVRIREFIVDGVDRPVARVSTELPGISKVWVPKDKLPAE